MAHVGRGVAIVGAGYAGMAAAVALAERGVRATVFESGAVPGGRARRVMSQGTELDNGQHILIGAYTELYRLMQLVGVPANALLRMPLEIRYAAHFSFRRLGLPEPLGLAGGLLAARGIPFAERIGAARFIARLRRSQFRLKADMPVSATNPSRNRRTTIVLITAITPVRELLIRVPPSLPSCYSNASRRGATSVAKRVAPPATAAEASIMGRKA